MAVNQLSSLMTTEIPAPGRSNFQRGYINRFTASLGYGYPVAVVEIIPNTRVRADLSSLIKSDPLVSSLYGTIRQSWQAFFVPSRLYVKELDNNSRTGITIDELENVGFPVIGQKTQQSWTTVQGSSLGSITLDPTIRTYQNSSITASEFESNTDAQNDAFFGVVPTGGLLDMLGYFPAEMPIRRLVGISKPGGPSSASRFTTLVDKGLNAIPFIAYYDIFRNYYMNMQDPYPQFVLYESNDTVNLFPDVDFWERLDDLLESVYSRSGQQGINVSTLYGPTGSQSAIIKDYPNGWNILSLNHFEGLISTMLNKAPWASVVSSENVENHVHAGYWRRCYDDDYFTSKLSSTYVGQLDSTARVNVSGNTFSVQQLRYAQRDYRYTKKNLLANSQRYDDWLDVHYGAKLNRALNIPHFLGSMSTEFYFDDVYATAATGGENGSVGDRAAVLNTSANAERFIDFEAEEHGYLIVLFSLIPRVDYFGGTKKMFLKDSLADIYKTEFDAVGFQDYLRAEVDGLSPSWDTSFGKQVSWFEYMTSHNELHGLFTLPDRSFMTLARDLGYVSDGDHYEGITSHIEPWKFQKIFQETALWKDNFYVQMKLDLTCYQPMSKQIISQW